MVEQYHNPGVDEALLGRDLFGEPIRQAPQPPLAERFGVPPFSVLDARQGEWQERKRQWLALGIQSELGRGAQAHTQPIGAGGGGMCDALAPRAAPGGAMFPSDRIDPATGKFARADLHAGYERQPDGSVVRPAKGLLSQATERKGYGADYDTSKGENAWGGSGTSIFDPMLCELAYRWWCPKGGAILDPFAGGSVRGIVAGLMGYAYTGCELSGAQVAANEAQREAIAPEARIWWHKGDSCELLPALATMLPEHGGRPAAGYDFMFSCPPYYDLEVYSEHPADLSAMAWPDFCRAYRRIIEAACALLKPDAFACFVVGDVRDERGLYRGFPNVTTSAFASAGLSLYNEAVLVTSVGSLPIRSGKIFDAGRKLGKSHQNVLCYVKGDPKRAAQACIGGA